jgi:hypothetical protein
LLLSTKSNRSADILDSTWNIPCCNNVDYELVSLSEVMDEQSIVYPSMVFILCLL